MTSDASRNGTTREGRPETGERGVGSLASSYTDGSLFAYGDRRVPTATELDRMIRFDPWADAIDGALTWPIRSANWSVKEADGDRGEAEMVREQFAPLAARAIAGALSAVGRRVAFAEQVWDIEGSLVVLRDLAFRPVDQCQILPDRNGRAKGFRQRAWGSLGWGSLAGRGFVNEDFLFERRKAFVFFHDGHSRPGSGRSALESAYQHHLDKQKLLFYRYKSLEKYGGPSTHGKTNAQPGTEARTSFDAAVRDARSGASITTGLEDEISYLAPPNAGDAFQRALRDLNFEMAVSSFVQFLALAQEGNSGAYALSRDHSDFLTIVTEGRMREIADAFTGGPIRDTVFFNFGPGAAFPTFEFEPLSEHVSKRMTEAAKALFAKTGRPMPQWMAEGVAEGYARSLGIEKPEDADPVGEPVRTGNDREEGDS